jgi:glyoxylase-like metal-dependent hydrolase (beta-lactamase superfamily II)
MKKFLCASVSLCFLLTIGLTAQQKTPAPSSLRLYVLDCGWIVDMDPKNYDLKMEEIKGPLDFITPCYLVVHPRGTLMWDVGEIPDAKMTGNGPWSEGPFRANKKLLPQLAALGYTPSNITYMAMSHYHGDHSANANEFVRSTWIVQEAERAAMFMEPAPPMAGVENYGKLKDAKSIVVKNTDHDVFGDGTVIIKFAPGHTPGHQMLFLKLPKTGPVLLAGDLFHYPEERTLNRIPSFDTSRDQTRQSRQKMEEFLKTTKAQLWIQHDKLLYEKIKHAPAYLD